MWKYFLVVAVAYFVYNLYSTYLLKSAVIYVKAAPHNNDIQHVGMLSHTDSVYKILRNIDDHLREGDAGYRNKWSHIILSMGFHVNNSIENYVSAVKSFNSVKEISVVVIEPWKFPAHHIFNIFMKVWKLLGKYLGYLPTRPLHRSDKPVFVCNIHNDTDPVFIFNLLSINSNEIFAKYATFMFTKVFPTINSKIYYTANPSGDDWNELSVVSYESHKTLCELAESQIMAEHIDLKRDSVSDSYTHLCKKIF